MINFFFFFYYPRSSLSTFRPSESKGQCSVSLWWAYKVTQLHLKKKTRKEVYACAAQRQHLYTPSEHNQRVFGWKETCTNCHPSYIPDLVSCNYWMFPTSKYKLHKDRFELDHKVRARVQNFLKSLPQKEFEKTILRKWSEQMRNCITLCPFLQTFSQSIDSNCPVSHFHLDTPLGIDFVPFCATSFRNNT